MTRGVPILMDEMDILKSDFVTHLAETPGCTVSTAAMHIGISRSLAYQWRQMDQAFDAAVNWAQKVNKKITKDFVEHSLLALVAAGNTAATIYAAKTLLRDRGYIEPQHTIKETTNLTLNKTIHFTVVSKPYAPQPEFNGSDLSPPKPVSETDGGNLPQ